MNWLTRLLARLRPSLFRPVPAPTPEPPPVEEGDGSIAGYLLLKHNAARAKRGFTNLTFNSALQAIAQAHSEAMARSSTMSHDGAGDGSFELRIGRSPYPFAAAGENIAAGAADVPAVMLEWLNSPGHRQNILGPYTDFGGAVVSGRGVLYWTTVFDRPQTKDLFPGQRPTIRLGRSSPGRDG